MIERAVAAEPVDTTAEVETPEHVRFRYQVAGPAKRAIAWLVDGLVRAAILSCVLLIAVVCGVASGDAIARASSGVVLLLLFVLEWGYYVFCETLWSGRTPGKRAVRLRVVTEGGHPLGFADSLLRNLLRAADFLPAGYALGLAVMGRDPRFRRLGDLVAGTMVIVEERLTVAPPLHLHPPPTAQELRGLPQRMPLSGEDLDAIELFLRRSGRLSPLREDELAEMVAPIFARKLGVRYRDAKRFLGLVHHRAHEKKGA